MYAYQRSKEELDKILLAGAGIQLGSDRASEFLAQKGKAGYDEKTPRQTRRTARTISIGNEKDLLNTENMNSNNRMINAPHTIDVS